MFKLLLSFTCCLLLCACASTGTMRLYEGPALAAQQEAQLTLPLEFDLIELDGQAVSSLGQKFRPNSLTIKLAPGPHILVLRYSNIFELDDENHDSLSSGQLVFKLNMQAGEAFTVLTPRINNYESALQFVKNPKASLTSPLQSIDASHIKKQNALVLSKKETPVVRKKPNLMQLKFWWQQASKYEQDEFLLWVRSE